MYYLTYYKALNGDAYLCSVWTNTSTYVTGDTRRVLCIRQSINAVKEVRALCKESYEAESTLTLPQLVQTFCTSRSRMYVKGFPETLRDLTDTWVRRCQSLRYRLIVHLVADDVYRGPE